MTRDPAVRFVVAALVLTGAGVGIAAAVHVDEPVDLAVTCPGADGRTRELRACLADVLVYVETPLASGSGVLLADGHIVTNAHVVDPYRHVDLVFDGGERFEHVEVLGVDAYADIAVLAPIDVDRTGVTIAAVPDYGAASAEPEVFLAGYPGGVEGDEPHITLSSGVLARVRTSDPWKQTYFQTDATIAGGQSGGALIDGNGRILGVSGLSFAGTFALALSADDVLDAIDAIIDDGGDEWQTIPEIDDVEAGEVDLEFDRVAEDSFAFGGETLFLPAAEEDREVRLDTDPADRLRIEAWTRSDDLIGFTEAEFDPDSDADFGDVDFEYFDGAPFDEPEPGTFVFEAPSDEDVFLIVSSFDDDLRDASIGIDVPFLLLDNDEDSPIDIDVGDTARGIVDGFSPEVSYELKLDRGDVIEITTRSPIADTYFYLLAPGEEKEDFFATPSADDGAGGLFDVDAQDRFEIERSGTWTIIVGAYDGIVSGYELSVTKVDTGE